MQILIANTLFALLKKILIVDNFGCVLVIQIMTLVMTLYFRPTCPVNSGPVTSKFGRHK